MSDDPIDVDPTAQSRVTRNIDALHHFMQAALDEPSMLKEIPSGADLVLLPDDDPELADANLRGGIELVRQGRNITFHHVRTLASTRS